MPNPHFFRDSETLIVQIDRRGPIDLDELTASLAAISRLYNRHCGETKDTVETRAPRLYVTHLETGSLIAHFAPLAPLLGQAVEVMDAAVTIRDFTKMLGEFISAFARKTPQQKDVPKLPSREDTKDLRDFLKPVTAQSDAKLNLRAARFKKKKPNGEEVSVEYEFASPDLNLAALNIEREIEVHQLIPSPMDSHHHKTVREKLMYFEQASREVPKSVRRASDKAVIQDVSLKPVKVYFPEGAADIKRAILEGSDNPFSKGYIVDVSVQYVGDEPKLYNVMRLHQVIDLDD